jgi:hypothetical protein
MKENKTVIISGVIFLFLISIVIINYRYPFITQHVGRWSVGFHQSAKIFSALSVNSQQLITYSDMDSILKTRNNYIADPFFIKENGIYYLFVELKGNKDADIALFTSENGESYNYKGIVLDESFHLSYPQVFKHENIYYMLPETSQSNKVLLYKALKFPYNWVIADTLLKNIRLKDPSILLSSQRNLIVGVDDHSRQLMFEADSLSGDWKEILNYKQRKGNETRPAGRFFEYGGDWYLPIQDRSLGYGSGVSIYKLVWKESVELVKFNSRYLHEQPGIKWFNRGMHHIDIQKDSNLYYMVYDGDRNTNGKYHFQVKRSLKFSLFDLLELINELTI